MRLAIFAPDPTTKDGIAAHTQQIVNAWEQAGHVVMWCYPGSRGTHVVSEAASADGGPEGLRQTRSAKAALEAFRPDLVIALFAIPAVRTSLGSLILRARAMKRSGVPVLICCHEASRELAILGPACRIIYRLLRWCGTGFVAFSAREARVMVESGLAPAVTTVPLGIEEVAVSASETERVKQSYRLHDPMVLAVGWVTHSKGTDLLLHAAPEVKADVGHVQYIVAGEARPRKGIFRVFGRVDQRYEAALRAEVAARGDSVDLRMVGYVPDHDLAPLMRAATVIVLPYRTVTQSAIATRALASGASLVVSDLPGMVTQLGTAARYFRTDDHHDLARVLSEVLNDAAVRADLAKAAREHVMAEAFSRVAEEILAAGRGSGGGSPAAGRGPDPGGAA